MSSTTNYDKTALESGGGAAQSAPPPNFFRVDLILRLFVFAATVTALVVLVTSKDTETIVIAGLPPPFASVTRDAKFNYSPAFIYLLVALIAAILYSIVTIISSCSLLSSPAPSTKILFNLIVFDALVAGILASAIGSAASVAYLGLRGNSHTNWNKVCGVFGKFCKHVGGSTAVTLAATVALVLLVALSSYSLYRRSR